MLSLSTSWCPDRFSSLAELLTAGRRMGFRSFELGVSSVPFDQQAVSDAMNREGIEIASIHAVCSERDVPGSTRRGDWVAEPDESLRREGVALVKDTLDVARRVGAPAIVLHGGILPIPDAQDFQLGLYRLIPRAADPSERRAFLARLIDRRREIVPRYLRALEASLKELCAYAPNVVIGLETRYFVSDLPHGDEFQMLFDRVDALNLRYWHDVGHAHVLERLGLGSQLDLLGRYGDQLAGMHLHDVRGFEDHRPPGKGDLDFDPLIACLRPGVIRVMEIASDHSARAVKRGKKHLATRYHIT